MMVSANSASCVPAEPTVAGTSALKKRRTSSSQVERVKRRHHAGAPGIAADEGACSTPEISTPQAAA